LAAPAPASSSSSPWLMSMSGRILNRWSLSSQHCYSIHHTKLQGLHRTSTSSSSSNETWLYRMQRWTYPSPQTDAFDTDSSFQTGSLGSLDLCVSRYDSLQQQSRHARQCYSRKRPTSSLHTYIAACASYHPKRSLFLPTPPPPPPPHPPTPAPPLTRSSARSLCPQVRCHVCHLRRTRTSALLELLISSTTSLERKR